MLVMTARFGLKRSIQDSASLMLKWLACGGVAQAIDDPEIEIFQGAPALARDVAEVGRVGGIADAIAERGMLPCCDQEGRQRHRTALALMVWLSPASIACCVRIGG